MIVVDIETSGGFNPGKNGIWQIGALEFENPDNFFLQEARIDEEDKIEEAALNVIGKTREELRDKNKQAQKKLLENFFLWASKIENNLIVAHNTPFDYGFLCLKAEKYGLKFPFDHRTLDLHALAVMKYLEINKKLPFTEGKSTMGLSKVMELCGLKDKRVQVKEGKIVKEGDSHNGLEDAKIEAECLSRILYGRGLLKKFEEFPIPSHLKNDFN